MKWPFGKKKVADKSAALAQVFRLENTFNVHGELIGLDNLIRGLAISTAELQNIAGKNPTKNQKDKLLFNTSVLTYLNALRLNMNNRQGKKIARTYGFSIECKKPHIPEIGENL